jgi:hypothetical protein
MERIFLYTPKAEKRAQVQKLCQGLGMECREILPKDLNRYVAEVTGSGSPARRPVPPEQAPVFYQMPELMLFYGLADGRLDVFLEEYKKAGIDRIDLKAVITPINNSWTIYELACELKRENDQMR